MRISRFLVQFLLIPMVFFALNAPLTVQAFTGAYGINYGRIADNIPSPDEVVTLLRAAKIKNVRIYDFDHSVLKAFSGTGLELVVGLPNGYLKDMSANADHALTWVKENVQAFLPDTHIRGIAIGNEVLGGSDQELWGVLLGAVKNVYNALEQLHLTDVVQVSTAHSQAVFADSYPPSSCVFTDSVSQYMKPLLQFFSQIGSPFCLNAYPFLAYMSDPEEIDINYALFQKTSGIDDQKNDLHYDNMLDAQIDAAYTALEVAGFKKMEVIVTETGWASHGDGNEAAATAPNARTFNYNLRKRLAKKKGTPLRPKTVLKAYVFAVFNENLKPGPTSERNFGLFKADGSISYDIGFNGLKSSSAASSLLSLKARGMLKCHNHGNLVKQWPLIREDGKANSIWRSHIEKSGLLQLRDCAYRWCNMKLICAFVERWHPETNTFQFKHGRPNMRYLNTLPRAQAWSPKDIGQSIPDLQMVREKLDDIQADQRVGQMVAIGEKIVAMGSEEASRDPQHLFSIICQMVDIG